MYQGRSKTLAEFDHAARFFLVRPSIYDAKAVQKFIVQSGGLNALREARPTLASVRDWSASSLEDAVVGQVGKENLGKIAQPLRIALSGTAVTPPIFDTLACFEREEVIARVDACINAFS